MLRIRKILILSLSICCFLFGDGFALEFSDVFHPKGEINLQSNNVENCKCLAGFRISNDGKIWITDECNGNIKIYNMNGGFLKIVGKKAERRYDFKYALGQFRIPTDLVFSPDSKVYVVDLGTGKVSILDSTGNFLGNFATGDDSTWCVDGYSILINKFKDIIIGGIDTNWLGLHVYTPQGKHKMSSFQIDKKFLEFSPISTPEVHLSLDSAGNIWAINSLTYCAYKFSPDGVFIQKFLGKSPLYKPPFKYIGPSSSKGLETWARSWTPLANISVTQKGLIILCTQIYQPFNYLLEIYNEKGERIVGDILTNNLLLTSDKSGTFYFLMDTSGLGDIKDKDESRALKIGKFSLSIPAGLQIDKEKNP